MRTQDVSSPDQPSIFSRRRADTERLEAQLAEWSAIIAQCRAGANRAVSKVRVEFDRTADELQRLRNEAGIQVMNLKTAVDFGWEDSVSELDRSWEPIRITFQRAVAKF